MREYFEVIIYSGESETKQVILEKAKKKFNVDVV